MIKRLSKKKLAAFFIFALCYVLEYFTKYNNLKDG